MREIKFRQWDSFKKLYYLGIGCSDGCWSGSPYVSWDKYPLEQFTGLKDINGVEIYEGDILKCIEYPDYEPVEVKFVAPMFLPHGWGLNGFVIGGYTFEVIGNIHKNPELLEGR